MKKKVYIVLSVFVMVAAVSCFEGNNDGPNVSSEQGALGNLQAFAGPIEDDNSDINGIRYTITSCDDPNFQIIVDRPLEDQVIPGNLLDLQNNPFDENSEHLFADLFQVVDPGCYNVHAQPVDAKGNNSEVCAAAWKNGVIVEESYTTEVFLIVQCEGSDPGAIDLLAAIIHEPDLDDVYFVDSKFVCGSPERICMNGSDVDNDPLEFELVAPDGCEVVPVDADQITDDACFDLTCHDFGRFDLVARVFDLAWNGNEMVRIEDWLEEAGYPSESHAELNFYAYFDGIKFYPDVDQDGFGNADADATLVCEGDDPPAGFVTDNTDCDDNDPTTYPGAEELTTM